MDLNFMKRSVCSSDSRQALKNVFNKARENLTQKNSNKPLKSESLMSILKKIPIVRANINTDVSSNLQIGDYARVDSTANVDGNFEYKGGSLQGSTLDVTANSNINLNYKDIVKWDANANATIHTEISDNISSEISHNFSHNFSHKLNSESDEISVWYTGVNEKPYFDTTASHNLDLNINYFAEVKLDSKEMIRAAIQINKHSRKVAKLIDEETLKSAECIDSYY